MTLSRQICLQHYNVCVSVSFFWFWGLYPGCHTGWAFTVAEIIRSAHWSEGSLGRVLLDLYKKLIQLVNQICSRERGTRPELLGNYFLQIHSFLDGRKRVTRWRKLTFCIFLHFSWLSHFKILLLFYSK